MQPQLGAGFLVHWRDECERVRHAVRSAEKAFDAWQIYGVEAHDVLVERMQLLRDELQRHFQQEERGGCLEEAACREPSLGPETEQVLRDHPRLLGRLDRVLMQLKDEQHHGRLGSEFLAFLGELRRHKQRKDQIIRRGFQLPYDDPL